jgi:hypothetical protein
MVDPTPAVCALAQQWPYRYLGVHWRFQRTHTLIHEARLRDRECVFTCESLSLSLSLSLCTWGRTALHDDESIFPYARSRVGRSFQIEVPDEGGVQSALSFRESERERERQKERKRDCMCACASERE